MRRLLDAFQLTGVNMIAASIKDARQAVDAVIAGAHSVAVPFPVFEAMCDHPLTREGLEEFTGLYRSLRRARQA
ncbi:MAG: hypothetical protein ACOC8N_10105 [Spirochaetota bacterium]